MKSVYASQIGTASADVLGAAGESGNESHLEMECQVYITAMTSAEFEKYMGLLHRAIVLVRCACQEGNLGRAEAIADAIHVLPTDLLQPKRLESFRKFYLEPLAEQYPDLQELLDMCPKICKGPLA